MTNLANKELLLLAIQEYSLYTVAQRKLLQILVNLSVDNTVIITAKDLTKAMNTTKVTVYTALELFKKDGIVEIPSSQGAKLTSCRLKQTKLNEIISHYNKKSELNKK